MKIYIKDVSIVSKTELSVGKFKAFICKLFNIVPTKLYYLKIHVEYEKDKNWPYFNREIRFMDTIVTSDKHIWKVASIFGLKLELLSIKPIDFMCPCGPAYIISQAQPDGSDKPQSRIIYE